MKTSETIYKKDSPNSITTLIVNENDKTNASLCIDVRLIVSKIKNLTIFPNVTEVGHLATKVSINLK